jgi:dTDP-4-dehydrorhamnose 3,5-epimerase
MGLELISKHLNGIMLFKPKVFGDSRGFFYESYKDSEFKELGINVSFAQDNHSKSSKNVLRGMHFQWDKPQGKLLRVVKGACLFVELDIRKNSPTLGQHSKFELNEDNKHILWVPAGFANSFLTLEDNTEVLYKCTAEWNPKAESAIRWNDPELAIDWGTKNPELSEKDANAHTLKEWLGKEESKYFLI